MYTLDISSPNSSPKEKVSGLNYKRFCFDYNGRSCAAEASKKLYYINLDNNESKGKAILSKYERIIKKNVNKDRTAVFYIDNGKYYFNLYNKTTLVFKTVCDMAIDPVNPAIYSNEKNEIIYYERVRYTKEKGKKVSPHMRTVSPNS